MLRQRIITAIVLLVVFVLLLALASVDVFALALSLVVAAAAWEWGRLVGLSEETAQSGYAIVVGLLTLVGLYLPNPAVVMHWLSLPGVLFWIAVPVLFYWHPKRAAIEQPVLPLLLAGVLYLVVAAMAIQYLRSVAAGSSNYLLLYALAVVWVMDSGAYFSGRQFGRRKLAPTISPGKTWEGVYGGGAAVCVLIIMVWWLVDWPAGSGLRLFLATITAAGASVIGDLYESRIKRAAGRKDSSQLLPGHGGVLDRLDGVVAALPVFAFCWSWV